MASHVHVIAPRSRYPDLGEPAVARLRAAAVEAGCISMELDERDGDVRIVLAFDNERGSLAAARRFVELAGLQGVALSPVADLPR